MTATPNYHSTLVYNAAFKAPEWTDMYISKTLAGKYPYRNDNADIVSMDYIFSRVCCVEKGMDNDWATLITCGNVLAAHLEDSAFREKAKSEEAYIVRVKALLRNKSILADSFFKGVDPKATADLLLTPAIKTAHAGLAELPVTDPKGTDTITTFKQAVEILTSLGEHLRAEAKEITLQLIITCHLALATQGTVTRPRLAKYLKDLNAQSGLSIDVTPALLKEVYTHIFSSLKDSEVEGVAKGWFKLIPPTYVQCRNTLEFMAGAKMTCFNAIGQALVNYGTDAMWDEISKYIGIAEFTNFQKAASAVKGDNYYGYRSDLGPVKSTNFKNLGSICAYILTIEGNSTIASTKTFFDIETIKNGKDIKKIIDDYYKNVAASKTTDPKVLSTIVDIRSDIATANAAYKGFTV